ncbi:MAG: dockerin type I domain-containing protein [Planctomycetota bacterium]
MRIPTRRLFIESLERRLVLAAPDILFQFRDGVVEERGGPRKTFSFDSALESSFDHRISGSTGAAISTGAVRETSSNGRTVYTYEGLMQADFLHTGSWLDRGSESASGDLAIYVRGAGDTPYHLDIQIEGSIDHSMTFDSYAGTAIEARLWRSNDGVRLSLRDTSGSKIDSYSFSTDNTANSSYYEYADGDVDGIQLHGHTYKAIWWQPGLEAESWSLFNNHQSGTIDGDARLQFTINAWAEYPDLEVEPPILDESGINFGWKVHSSDIKQSIKPNVQLFFSHDETLDENDTLVYEELLGNSDSKVGSYSRLLTWESLCATYGSYVGGSLFVVLDSNDRVAESDESNNIVRSELLFENSIPQILDLHVEPAFTGVPAGTLSNGIALTHEVTAQRSAYLVAELSSSEFHRCFARYDVVDADWFAAKTGTTYAMVEGFSKVDSHSIHSPKFRVPPDSHRDEHLAVASLHVIDRSSGTVDEGVASAEQFEVFFRKYGDHDLDGDPNWFDYWARDMATRHGQVEKVKYAPGRGYGLYKPRSTSIFLLDGASEAVSADVQLPLNEMGISLPAPPSPQDRGDCLSDPSDSSSSTYKCLSGVSLVASTLRHELVHKYMHLHAHKDFGLADSDFDNVPDELEFWLARNGIAFEHDNPATFRSDWLARIPGISVDDLAYVSGDEETLARLVQINAIPVPMEMERWLTSAVPDHENDHANPGKNTTPSFLRLINGADGRSETGEAASIDGVMGENGVDQDDDGLAETLEIQLGITVEHAGSYTLAGTLYDANSNALHAISTVELDPGQHQIVLPFDGSEIRRRRTDGILKLDYLSLSGADFDSVLEDVYSTQNYLASEFAPRGEVEFDNVLHSSLVDTNGDGVPEQLEFEFAVQAYSDNFPATISGLLYTEDGKYLGQVSTDSQLNLGGNTQVLSFPVQNLVMSDVAGALSLKALTIKETGNGQRLDFIWDAYTTPAFQMHELGEPDVNVGNSMRDEILDENSDGIFDALSLSIPVQVKTLGSYIAIGQLEDWEGNKLTDLRGRFDLAAGDRSLDFTVPGSVFVDNQASGPYRVSPVLIYDQNMNLMDANVIAKQTSSYAWGEWTDDRSPPTSTVDTESDIVRKKRFSVVWQGDDGPDGTGVSDFSIYFGQGDSNYDLWIPNTTDQQATFEGDYGKSYQFYSIATDYANNVQTAPTEVGRVRVVSPWHNIDLPIDVDGDTFVSAIDALLVIDRLNTPGERQVDEYDGPPLPPFVDPSGDGWVSAVDALLVIDQLNSPLGEGEARASYRGMVPSFGAVLATEAFRLSLPPTPWRQADDAVERSAEAGGEFTTAVALVAWETANKSWAAPTLQRRKFPSSDSPTRDLAIESLYEFDSTIKAGTTDLADWLLRTRV